MAHKKKPIPLVLPNGMGGHVARRWDVFRGKVERRRFLFVLRVGQFDVHHADGRMAVMLLGVDLSRVERAGRGQELYGLSRTVVDAGHAVIALSEVDRCGSAEMPTASRTHHRADATQYTVVIARVALF